MPSISTRWLHLLGVLVLSVAIAACSGRTALGNKVAVGAPSNHTQQEGGANGSETTLNIVATGFVFALDASQVRAGTITFLVKNDAGMPYDFAIQGHGMDQTTGMLEPGHTASLTVDLKPGIYTYRCTIPIDAPCWDTLSSG